MQPRSAGAHMGDASSQQPGRAPHVLLETLLETEQVDLLVAADVHHWVDPPQSLPSDAPVQGRHAVDEEYPAQDASQAPAANNLIGMALYASSSLSLIAMLSCAHELTRRHGVPVFEVIFVRESVITATGLAALSSRLTQPASKHQSSMHRYTLTRRWDDALLHVANRQCGPSLLCMACRWRLLALRAVLGTVAISCSMWAVTLLPLGLNVILTALTPIWVALLAPSVLGEQPSRQVFGELCTGVLSSWPQTAACFRHADWKLELIATLGWIVCAGHPSSQSASPRLR